MVPSSRASAFSFLSIYFSSSLGRSIGPHSYFMRTNRTDYRPTRYSANSDRYTKPDRYVGDAETMFQSVSVSALRIVSNGRGLKIGAPPAILRVAGAPRLKGYIIAE
jgi:hypothetical protein